MKEKLNNLDLSVIGQHDDIADVLFIYPPLHRLYGERKQWMPLSILYLAAYLNEHGISSKAYNADCSLTEPEFVMSYGERFQLAKNYIKNLNSDNEIWYEVKNVIKNVHPKIIGISVLTEALGATKKIIDIIHVSFPNVVIVAGGPHAEIDPEYLLHELHVDYVIKGDGEKSFYDLAYALINNKDPYVILGDSIFNQIIHAVPIDVEELPIPKIEYHYRYNLSTSRGGCIYACKFCYCSKFKYALRFRSPKNVIKEISYYVENYQTKKIFFVDDTFTVNREYVKSICKLMIKKEFKVNWTCTTRAKKIDLELLHLMKRAGCKSIHIGVESGSPRMLEFIDKKINIDDVINAAKLIKDTGIECRLFFMAGLPTENPYDLRCTMDLIRQVNPDETIISMYVPIPGTPLYDLICDQFYPFNQIDWTTFSRDQLPYHSYIDDSDGTYDKVLHDLYQLVEELNMKKG